MAESERAEKGSVTLRLSSTTAFSSKEWMCEYYQTISHLMVIAFIHFAIDVWLLSEMHNPIEIIERG